MIAPADNTNAASTARRKPAPRAIDFFTATGPVTARDDSSTAGGNAGAVTTGAAPGTPAAARINRKYRADNADDTFLFATTNGMTAVAHPGNDSSNRSGSSNGHTSRSLSSTLARNANCCRRCSAVCGFTSW